LATRACVYTVVKKGIRHDIKIYSSELFMRERLFQRIWQNGLFSTDNLTTTCGKSVRIDKNGQLNTSDGPDFPCARVCLDGIIHFGSVELHTHCNDWYVHGHHHDPKYNSVVLHVVLYPDNAGPVRREDGTCTPTLVLQSGMNEQWQTSLFKSTRRETIPCAHFGDRVNRKVLEHQLNIAALEYFEEKRTGLMNHYDAGLPPSDAFLKMLFLGWCEGLGIPNNREAMKDFACRVLSTFDTGTFDAWPVLRPAMGNSDLPATSTIADAQVLRHKALKIAGLNSENQSSESEIYSDTCPPMKRAQWNFKGARGYNHPETRVLQAANVLQLIRYKGIRYFLGNSPEDICKTMSMRTYSGGERGSVLSRTVLLPALDILAELFHKPRLHDEILLLWLNIPATVPKTVKKAFSINDEYRRATESHAGSLRQYREYCSRQRCEGCSVFKNIIGG
jgi:hypothetical protein